MALTRSLLCRICPRSGASETTSTTCRIPAVAGGADDGRSVRAARRVLGALRTSASSTGRARSALWWRRARGRNGAPALSLQHHCRGPRMEPSWGPFRSALIYSGGAILSSAKWRSGSVQGS